MLLRCPEALPRGHTRLLGRGLLWEERWVCPVDVPGWGAQLRGPRETCEAAPGPSFVAGIGLGLPPPGRVGAPPWLVPLQLHLSADPLRRGPEKRIAPVASQVFTWEAETLFTGRRLKRRVCFPEPWGSVLESSASLPVCLWWEQLRAHTRVLKPLSAQTWHRLCWHLVLSVLGSAQGPGWPCAPSHLAPGPGGDRRLTRQ